MKLNIDLGYILKRLIVIGLGFVLISQLKSCDVFALDNFSTEPTINNSYWYSDTSNNNTAITPTSVSSGGSISWYKFTQVNNYSKLRIVYNLGEFISGYYDVSFVVYSDYNYISYTAFITGAGSSLSSCYSDVSSSVPDTTDPNSVLGGYQSFICKNVYLNGSQFNLFLGSLGNRGNSYSTYVGKKMSFIGVQDVSSSINSQSQQQHQDSQNVQNKIDDVNSSINDSDVSQAEQSGNSIFNTNNPDIVNYGLESVITAPIQILARATDSCSPLSFSIFHKTITLPCGDALFWTKDFSSYNTIFSNGETDLNTTRNTFRAFWNLFFGGAIIFHLLTILYEVLNKAIDPTNDDLYFISDAIDSSSKSSSPVVRDSDGDGPRHVNGSSYNPKHSKQSRLIHSKEQSDAVVLGSLK